MDTCPIVELGVLGAHLKKKKEKKRETEKKKERKKMIPMVPLISNMPVRDDKLFKKVKSFDLGV